jgi:hypothetical protein
MNSLLVRLSLKPLPIWFPLTVRSTSMDGAYYLLLAPAKRPSSLATRPAWSEYLFTLDSWEHMLLQCVHFTHQSPFDIYNQLSTADDATLMSDGSINHLQGTTVWVIAIGVICFVRGQCPVPGFDPRSYHAKGYGILCGLLFEYPP